MPFNVRAARPLENVFLQAVRSGKQSIGYWGARGLAPEFGAAAALFPYQLLDFEHNFFGVESISRVRDAMLARSNSTLLVRVPDHTRAWTQRALDAGAQGIMFPMIETAKEAADAASLCLYPPKGKRGMGYAIEFASYGLYPNYLQEANDNTAVIVQIETKKALKNAERIIATPNISAVFFGPADMAASLGYTGNFDHPEVKAAVDTVLKLSKKHKVPCGTLAASEAKAKERLEQGFDYVFPNYALNMQQTDLEKLAKQYAPINQHLTV